MKAERRTFLTRHYRTVTESRLMKEGLAVYGSEGGGADRVSDREAWLALAAGKHLLAPQFGGADSSDLLYRQAGMFVAFLATTDAEAFKRFLFAVEAGQSADKAIPQFFGEPVDDLWNRFLLRAERETNP